MGCLIANDGHVSCRRLAAGDTNYGGESRDFAVVHGIDRRLDLRLAGGSAHPLVVVGVAGVAGNGAGVEQGGARSTALFGHRAAAHKRAS